MTARVVWERDGAETIDTLAMAYTRDAVLVEITDLRYRIVGVWLAPGDVRRR